MKLGEAREGVVYCTRGFEVGTWLPGRGYERRGRLPVPSSGVDGLRFRAKNGRLSKRLLRPLVGAYTSANVWPIDDERLLATVGRFLFHSPDRGHSWRVVRELPESSGLMGVLPTSVCVHGARVYLAEYTLGDEPARILVSDDRGESWSTFLATPDFRHFHGLFHDPHSGRLWGCTGDTNAASTIGVFVDGEYVPLGGGSQRWRAVEVAFTPEYVLWGMDCSFVDDTAVLRLSREELDADEPEPEVVGIAPSSVFYAETVETPDDTWVAVSTASETGVDSTAPPDKRQNTCSRDVAVLAAPAAADFETWYEVASFTRRRTLADLTERLPTAGAYVFLASCDELGLAVNPYNVADRHGEVFAVAPEAFRSIGDRERETATPRR